MYKHGFTLIELLVVVLIVGILIAVAVPLYKNAVDKSRWSTLLAPVAALRTAQEEALLTQGTFAAHPDDLTISLPGQVVNDTYTLSDASYTLTTPSEKQTFVRGSSNRLPGVRLYLHLTQAEGLDEKLFCEAAQGNDRANKLCNKLLQGQLVDTKDGYNQYLLNYAGPCVWSASQGKCFDSVASRCSANGMNYFGGVCGYTDTQWQEVGEGGSCEGTTSGFWTCAGTVLHDGAVCNGWGDYACAGTEATQGTCNGYGSNACTAGIYNAGGVCNGETADSLACAWSTFNTGSACYGKQTGTCTDSTFEAGSRCYALASGTCTGTYKAGSCCVGGDNCPSNADPCVD
ncbi:MAG: prepilin-type N-terminal cleavage/methylation domain-containing protein [Elusimicrobiaceae bacterium]|nr:prepilin-type N-terminal cleavage/methylation domain-containing protein [Elusimicrobiaceae bacterium]